MAASDPEIFLLQVQIDDERPCFLKERMREYRLAASAAQYSGSLFSSSNRRVEVGWASPETRIYPGWRF